MPERASVYEGAQLGPETTPGTVVAATARLLSMEINPNRRENVKPHRQMGVKFNTGAQRGKGWSEGSYMGAMDYRCLNYVLNSILQKVTPTTPTTNGVWSVTVGVATAGTFTLTFNGDTAAGLAYNITAADLQTALEALTTIGVGNVIVTGAAPTWIVKFVGALSTSVLALTGNGAGLTGGGLVITTTAAVNARRWTFFPNYLAPDSIQTYTLEKGVMGVAGFAQQMGHMVFNNMSLKMNKDEASISGDILGQLLSDSNLTTLTSGGITEYTVQEVDPAEVSIFVGRALVGANAVQRLTRCLDVEFNLNGRFRPVITLDATKPSLSALVEAAAEYALQFTMMHDSAGIAMLENLLDVSTQYVVIEATGDNIEGTGDTAFPFRYKMTCPIKLIQPDRDDRDGVYSDVFNAQLNYEPTFGGGIKVEIDTDMTTL